MRLYGNDTIAAISTAVGEGGIGIVRVSGQNALEVVEKIIREKSGEPLSKRKSRTMFLAMVIDPADGVQVDEVLVSVMRAPNTYTREDIVEINCHGGIIPLRKTLSLVLKAGARAAEPGEFTKRAFLNGRIDLAQAEAVIDAIKAKTDLALKSAVNQIEGGLSKEINTLAEKVADVLTQIEAAVDFSDEDIEVTPYNRLIVVLGEVERKLEEVIKTSIAGQIIKEGIRTVIVGRPNVGKSSLLNALLKKERAIVTPVPGTTRDVIEEVVNVNGIPLVLKDTAGLREPEDEVEKIGVELTKRTIKTAEIALCVIDGSEELQPEDVSLLNEVNDTKAILVINKADLPRAKAIGELKLPSNFVGRVEISALTGAGMDELKLAIERSVLDGGIDISGTSIVTNARHEQLLKSALRGASEAVALINAEQPEEIIATVLNEILDDLGEITGEHIGEDVLGRIFSQFCIGK